MTHSSPTKITVPETIGPASGAARQQARPLSAKRRCIRVTNGNCKIWRGVNSKKDRCVKGWYCIFLYLTSFKKDLLFIGSGLKQNSVSQWKCGSTMYLGKFDHQFAITCDNRCWNLMVEHYLQYIAKASFDAHGLVRTHVAVTCWVFSHGLNHESEQNRAIVTWG